MYAPVRYRKALTADWLWLGPGGLRKGGWLVLDKGRVAGVVEEPPSDCRKVDLGAGLLMPGLVNAHCHLELSCMAGLIPPQGDFVAWVESLVQLRPGLGDDDLLEAASSQARNMVDMGVACLGDVTNRGICRDLLAEAGLSTVSFHEALGPKMAEPPRENMALSNGLIRADAVAAHAPYSVPAWRIKALKKRSGKLPFCIHLAESLAEMEFFDGQGEQGDRLERFMNYRGEPRLELELTAKRPLAHLMNLGVVDDKTLLIHCVQLSPEEVGELAVTGASVCVCPRSNLGLTGKIAPVKEMLAAGVNLALGTDSLASTPDLSLWKEMETLAGLLPELSAEAILTMATLGGARALMLGDQLGSFEDGRVGAAAFVPLAEGLSAGEVLDAVVRGRHTGKAGRADKGTFL